MKLARILVIGAAATAAQCAIPAIATAEVKVVPYTKSGNWNVRAVFSANGAFNHCSGTAQYQSGTRVSIIVYANTNWRLWFAHSSWPSRPRSTFASTVRVDGRVVLNRQGVFTGRNAYVDLGRDVSRVRALMRGQSMAISTPAGTSRFKLTGTNRATQAIARCWKANNLRTHPNSGGAFGGNAVSGGASGAFGGGTTARRSGSNQLPRGATMEIATEYLSKAPQSYSILPKDKSPLKHFPVNWKMQDGSIGGMRVFSNTSASVDKLLGVLLSDQAKNCKGRNATEREPSKLVRDRRIARARGVCETSTGSVLNVSYKVAELGRRMIMIVMEVKTTAGGVNSGTGQKRSRGKDDAIYIPGPSEL